MVSASIVSSVAVSVSPSSQSLRFGSAGDRLIVYAASIVSRLYCSSPFYCLALLLSDVASSYAIVRTSYCFVVAIVSDFSIVITYAYYWVV